MQKIYVQQTKKYRKTKYDSSSITKKYIDRQTLLNQNDGKSVLTTIEKFTYKSKTTLPKSTNKNMKRIYKYSKKGKQRNNQKTKIKKIYEMQNLINPKSIDQTNKSNSGFSGHCMNQKK